LPIANMSAFRTSVELKSGRAGAGLGAPVLRPCTLLGLMLAVPAMAWAQAAPDIGELSLEQLATIQVTSVSKRPESLADAPASIFVITGAELRRSSATTLAEALRLAPNLQVAREDARNYVVTSRGSANVFANKLLVLIDGRIVYSPLFSGVFWDAQDLILDDVERIEVISGPGATLWGANAVNGVINITTRGAGATQGTQAIMTAGSHERDSSLRHGGRLANGGHYRVYAKFAEAEDTETAAGQSTLSGWRRRQAGFRAGWGHSSANYVVHGDAYEGTLHQPGTLQGRIGGANLNGRMSRALANGSRLDLRAYWDHTTRKQPGAIEEHLDILDVQMQHGLQAAPAHQVVWGGGVRYARDRVQNDLNYGVLPGVMDMRWTNLFLQDEISVREDLKVTAGLKLERNSYTGLEVLPTLRLAWKPAANALWWGALSRAVRAPARVDRDFHVPTRPPVINGVPLFGIAGGPDFQSEVARVGELGYRAQPSATLSASVTAFFSEYDRLRTLEPNPSGPGRVFSNLGWGRTRGLEAWGHWQAAPHWRLSAGAVVQRIRTGVEAGSRDSSGTTALATFDPSHYWTLRSQWDIAPHHELDATLRRVGGLDRTGVPAYTALDLRYGWRLSRSVDLALLVRNAADPGHAEWGSRASRSEIPRSVQLKLVWRPAP
jgi:iron complex outermembrane receptor protein